MSGSGNQIGIKIANGSFYPILDEENKGSKKRLVLTTVKDEQESVQIDLYKGTGTEVSDAVYIGSLLIENIQTAEKGSPEIALIVGIDDDGTLTASAGEDAVGDFQSLSVSLETLDSDKVYEIPDFELDNSPDIDLPDFDESADIEGTADLTMDEPSFDNMTDNADESMEDFSFDEPAMDEPPLDDSAELSADDFSFDEPALDEPSFDNSSAPSPDDDFSFDEPSFEEPDSVDSTVDTPDIEEPDFDSSPVFDTAGGGEYTQDTILSQTPVAEPKKRANPLLLVLFVLMGLLAIAALIWLAMRLLPGDAGSELPTDTEPTAIVQPAETEEPASDSQDTEAETETDAAQPEPVSETVASEPVPAKKGEALRGILYIIRWGDTLWDLAFAFYQNPWLFNRIADFNEIDDPDKIYAGTEIRIPESGNEGDSEGNSE